MSDIITFTERYWILLAALSLMLLSSAFMIRMISKNIAAKNDITRSIWSYAFLWPLLFTRKEDGKYVQRELTRKEWIGLTILALIMLLAPIFTPTTKR